MHDGWDVASGENTEGLKMCDDWRRADELNCKLTSLNEQVVLCRYLFSSALLTPNLRSWYISHCFQLYLKCVLMK